MAISIDWSTKVITVPQADLTFVEAGIYDHDTNQFHLDLRALEASENGMPELDTHSHNTDFDVAGVTYARVILIINGYTVTYENLAYRVNLIGSNNNIWAAGVLTLNLVQVIPGNSAGLISPSGQGIRDAMKLTPSGGAADTDSIDEKLDDNKIHIINSQV